MPAPVGVEGVAFVEFAADEMGAAQIGRMLSAMGFAQAGRHVSKNVILWRQGDINIVVNMEREGFAHSSFIVHGTSVYAIGLMVEDAGATVERARALGAEPFEQAPASSTISPIA